MPDALQMDNELAFRGSNRYPRSFGTVVRFALAMRVAPVFIPVAEPWRNGIIERFNNTYDKRFYRSRTFTDFDHLKQASGEFSHFHNSHHRYSTLDHKTPNQMRQQMLAPTLYNGQVDIEQRIPLLEGRSILFALFEAIVNFTFPTNRFLLIQA